MCLDINIVVTLLILLKSSFYSYITIYCFYSTSFETSTLLKGYNILATSLTNPITYYFTTYLLDCGFLLDKLNYLLPFTSTFFYSLKGFTVTDKSYNFIVIIFVDPFTSIIIAFLQSQVSYTAF